MSDIWSDVHNNTYAKSDWINKPSMFAEAAIKYFPKNGKILELGAGQGQDSRFFARHGYEVVSTDLEQTALDINQSKVTDDIAQSVVVERVDLREKLTYPTATFDVIYAHLSLHYFDTAVTQQLFDEIWRSLRSGGVFAFFTNSISDPEYGTGHKLEKDYFHIDSMTKRYFTVETARQFADKFTELLADSEGETYKDSAKGIHHLIRFIGKKPT